MFLCIINYICVYEGYYNAFLMDSSQTFYLGLIYGPLEEKEY